MSKDEVFDILGSNLSVINVNLFDENIRTIRFNNILTNNVINFRCELTKKFRKINRDDYPMDIYVRFFGAELPTSI